MGKRGLLGCTRIKLLFFRSDPDGTYQSDPEIWYSLSMIIRRSQPTDFESCYALGKATPELRVSATEEFMDPDEFRYALANQYGVFLVAEEDNKILGFIYATTDDKEKPLLNKWACLVYLAVAQDARRKGVATALYAECIKKLKGLGITNVYGWAHEEGKGGIVDFMKKEGFNEGHLYRWMDKKI